MVSSLISCASLTIFVAFCGVSVQMTCVFFFFLIAGLFVFLILNFQSSLHILETGPLSDMGLANIFPELVVFYSPNNAIQSPGGSVLMKSNLSTFV